MEAQLAKPRLSRTAKASDDLPRAIIRVPV